ncbi:MAG: hypothetical protein WC683_18590 [bacterium]
MTVASLERRLKALEEKLGPRIDDLVRVVYSTEGVEAVQAARAWAATDKQRILVQVNFV